MQVEENVADVTRRHDARDVAFTSNLARTRMRRIRSATAIAGWTIGRHLVLRKMPLVFCARRIGRLEGRGTNAHGGQSEAYPPHGTRARFASPALRAEHLDRGTGLRRYGLHGPCGDPQQKRRRSRVAGAQAHQPADQMRSEAIAVTIIREPARPVRWPRSSLSTSAMFIIV